MKFKQLQEKTWQTLESTIDVYTRERGEKFQISFRQNDDILVTVVDEKQLLYE